MKRNYYYDFNYEKLLEDIKKSGFSMRQISLIIGKSQGFLDQAMRNKKVNAETVDRICKILHTYVTDYLPCETDNSKDIEKPTEKQMTWVNNICNTHGIKFEGKTKQEAHEFISRYSNSNKDKDMNTLIMELSYQVQSMNKKMVEILEYVKKEEKKTSRYEECPFDD